MTGFLLMSLALQIAGLVTATSQPASMADPSVGLNFNYKPLSRCPEERHDGLRGTVAER